MLYEVITMSHGAIAELTEIPLGTVKSHINRGTRQLKKLLVAYQNKTLREIPFLQQLTADQGMINEKLFLFLTIIFKTPGTKHPFRRIILIAKGKKSYNFV